MKYIVEKNGFKSLETTTGFKPIDALIEYTGQILEEHVPYAVITNSVGVDGEVIQTVSVDHVARTAAESIDSKAVQQGDLKAARDSEIYLELSKVFLTLDPNSASAFYQTWQDMEVNPGMYKSLNILCLEQLKDSNGVILFNAGDVLNTEVKILSYATRKVEQAKEYGRWRMARISQYIIARTAIENA